MFLNQVMVTVKTKKWQLPFRFLFLSGIVAIVGVAPLGGTKALPGTEFDPRIAADFSGVKASTSLSLCEDPEMLQGGQNVINIFL